jgi:hypothetical protein
MTFKHEKVTQMEGTEKQRLSELVYELAGEPHNVEIVVATRFGSHLYGTDTPQSDTDIKGVFMPNRRMLFLNNVPKSISYQRKKEEGERNNSEDVDIDLWSFHYFIELAMKGETNAIDLLHANKGNIFISSEIWEDIYFHRSKFYTKSMNAFIGYARTQAARYGIRGSRIDAARKVLDAIEDEDPRLLLRMDDIWDKLPVIEHCQHLEDTAAGIKQYQVCGRTLQNTTSTAYSHNIIRKFLSNYGERARLAAENKGIDWEAVSHALRAATQLKEILVSGDLKYPLANADYLRVVKQGKLDYLNEVAPALENMMQELEELSAESKLPAKVDRSFWENFITGTIYHELKYLYE